MTTRTYNQTAEIIEFPRKTSTSAPTLRTGLNKGEPAKAMPAAAVSFSSAWYHDDAIEEAATQKPKH